MLARIREISNSDDMLDSRDIIARVDELEGVDERDADEAAELATLKALADEAEGYCPDWAHGATLVRDSYWIEYVQELLEDIGDLPKGLPHYIEIDWEATARNIRQDYTSVNFGNIIYWVR